MAKKIGKTIYDAGETECPNGLQCPKFVFNEKDGVSLVDKQRGRADMTIEEFNRFVRAVKTGELKEINSPRK